MIKAMYKYEKYYLAEIAYQIVPANVAARDETTAEEIFTR